MAASYGGSLESFAMGTTMRCS